MRGRFTSRKVELLEPVTPESVEEAPAFISPLPKIVSPETVPDATTNPLLSAKLLEAKVRLHRRLIEEINLSALEKLPRDEMKRQIHGLVSQYVMNERLALNTQELANFVEEILDEMLGLGPIEPLLKDPTVNDILINGHECVYIERAGMLEPTVVRFKDEFASSPHCKQNCVGGWPPCRRIASTLRRTLARRLARQRCDPSDCSRRTADVDSQIL